MSGRLVRIRLKDSKEGLTGSAGELEVGADPQCQFSISAGSGDYLRISAYGLSLDLTNPGKVAQLTPPADVSGQLWMIKEVVGCTKFPDGAVGRGVVGYQLKTMWTEGAVLTSKLGCGMMQAEGDDKSEWVIEYDDGKLWLRSDLSQATAGPEREPEIAVCDFEMPVLVQEAPRVAPTLCGGWNGGQPGGPEHLLPALRPLVLEAAKKAGFNEPDFKKFEFVKTTSQTVRGFNHRSRMRLDDNLFCTVRFYEPIDDGMPVEVRAYDHDVKEHDVL